MQLNLLSVLDMAHITPCMSRDVARMLQQHGCVQEMEQYVNEGRIAPVSWQTVGSTLYAFASGTARQCCLLRIYRAHSEYSAHSMHSLAQCTGTCVRGTGHAGCMHDIVLHAHACRGIDKHLQST